MRREGKLVVISGPSGVGKTTVCAELLKLPGFERVVTCTTRAPRDGEVDGRDYVFLSRERFERGIAEDMFLEHAVVHDNYYGTPRGEVEQSIRRGQHVLLVIDVQGAAQLRGKLPPSAMTTVFILPPDEATLERRLRGRGTDDTRAVAARLETARSELKEQCHYDVTVVNDTVQGAVRGILAHLGLPAPNAHGERSSCN